MLSKTIQMRHKTDSQTWENLFPVTIGENVITQSGESVEQSLNEMNETIQNVDLKLREEIDQLGITTFNRSGDELMSISSPFKTTTFNYDGDGVIQSTSETTESSEIETTYTRDNEGNLLQIERVEK